ncbi:helix-turn-helix transcriptional regulator [uncultured Veillonella sp.]|uniref:helix-turn-helix domain-containing protein n=1 Tax=uncultured Veillonella sp. TaxID=159268 RepID=UPI0025D6046B|nr:helix-turn-helix transcriptional regulator [uncultured Veillonella sp.]MDY3974787.1 helix-turn-helix transcriptional regulator [Veillonella caviae]
MDSGKIGQLILQLRKEKGLTQKELAEQLHITYKTVSKWECGKGIPDVVLWEPLSQVLGADVLKLLQGGLSTNQSDMGNIRRIKIYVCPHCGNILTSTSAAQLSCCGRLLQAVKFVTGNEAHRPDLEVIDGDNYLRFNHSMAKGQHIYFVAYVYDDFIWFQRLYAEQEAAVRLPRMRRGGKFLVYCDHGAFMYTKLW